MKTIAIIPAGGAGSRFGSPLPKQFLDLSGKPIIIRTLEVFENIDEVDEIYLPVHPDYLGSLKRMIQESGITKVAAAIKGGSSRQESVYNCIKIIKAEDDDIVLVHDAARPLVKAELVKAALKAASEIGACIPYTMPNDTVKSIKNGKVEETLNRHLLGMVQTPQAFKFGLLKEAYEKADKDGFSGTDDASLVEYAGYPVLAIKGDKNNIKVTDPIDIKIAKSILEEIELAR